MYYFKKQDSCIDKYKIEFDPRLLGMLVQDIIEECSNIEHMEYESDYAPDIRNTDEEEFRNFSYTKTDKFKEYFEEDRRIYLYKYDIVKYNPLVIAINRLIKGDVSAIDEIFDYKDDNKEIVNNLEEQISKLSDEIDKISNMQFNEKRKKLKELGNLVNELNKCKKIDPIVSYYEEAKKLISLNVVDSISTDEINRLASFFEIETNELELASSINKDCVALRKIKS